MIEVTIALVMALISLALSIFNTYTLFRAGLVRKEDLAKIIHIMSVIAHATPTKIDDAILAELEKLLEKYVLKR